MPFRKAVTSCAGIAVRQHNRQIAFNTHSEWGHNVGAIRVVRNLAKAFGLTLGTIHAVGHVQAFERRVSGWINLNFSFPNKFARRNFACQALVCNGRCSSYAVDLRPFQIKLFAMQKEWLGLIIGVGRKLDPAYHARGVWGQLKYQINADNLPTKGCVVRKIDRFSCVVHESPVYIVRSQPITEICGYKCAILRAIT